MSLLTEELTCNVVTELLVQWRNATMEQLMRTFLMLAVLIALHQDVVTILLTQEKNATEVHIALMFAQLACGSTITESRTTMELSDQCNHQSDSLKLALLDAH
jgi:NADPH-dependent glutamate synthase beta subunit-like oxidoreductase